MAGAAAVMMALTSLPASASNLRQTNTGSYVIDNEPYHSVTLTKKSSYDKSVVDGAVFRLKGTSNSGTPVDSYAVSGVSCGTVKTGDSSAWYNGLYVSNKSTTDSDGNISYTVSKSSGSGYTLVSDILAETVWSEEDAYKVQSATRYAMENGLYGNKKNSDNTISGMTGSISIGGLEQGTYVLTEVSPPEVHWHDGTSDHKTCETDKYTADTSKYAVTVTKNDVVIDSLTKETVGTTGSEEIKGYVIYDNKIPTHKVIVKKIWKDGLKHKPGDLAITITTKVPEISTSLYKLTFDANGGTFTEGNSEDTKNTLIFSTSSSPKVLNGTYKEPVASEELGTFSGWETSGNSTYYVYQKDGNLYANTSSGSTATSKKLSSLASTGDGSTLTAAYKKYAYAVQIYGICEDTLKEGSAGLTFGPAIGASYVSSYKSHTPSGWADDKNTHEHRCIHTDTWNEIVKNNKIDPYIYEQCLTNGCTKAIVLKFTADNSGSGDATKVFDTSGANSVTGDGAGILYYEINSNSRKWTDSSTTGFNWANSKIRAMLNGYNDNNTVGYTRDEKYYSSNVYSDTNSLLSAFPAVLQDNIGEKAVKYESVYTNYNKDTQPSIVYDKLWLFSNMEIYGESISGPYNYKNEGSQYSKTKGKITTGNYSGAKACNSNGYTRWWWLRSLYGYSGNDASRVYGDGGLRYDYVTGTYNGVSPGFVLRR